MFKVSEACTCIYIVDLNMFLVFYFWLRQEPKERQCHACIHPSMRLCTLCNRMALKEFLQHSKESRGVLGQASKQEGKGKELLREGRKLPREGKKEASKGSEKGSFQGKGGKKLLREERKEAS